MSKKEWLFLITIVIILFTIDPVYAGPGGTVAKAFFKTWWGKMILVVLTIVLLPLIIYVRLVEYRKERKIKKILAQLSLEHKEFSWLQLQKEFTNIIRRVYNAWTNEDMSEVKGYVNHWYWQNQQSVYLDQWKRENLKNVSNLRDIEKIRPLYLELTAAPNFEGSRIAIAIDVVAEDYLKDRDTNKIVQGKSGYESLEYVWFLEYTEGKWLLDEIREGGLSLEIAKTPNVIPETMGITV
ncbi:hypothetical protein ACSVH2_06450 [Flavobacterium sp. RSB2_4_14]|uniref:hypothetical protein n=1 Tax=Flavobacterium sp. RSB2_4_14 TaxID=3447665 RepID=UPI003F397781